MKKIVFSLGFGLALLTLGFSIHAAELSKGKSVKNEINKQVPVHFIPTPNLEQISTEDLIHDKKGERYRIGVASYVNLTTLNSGVWTTLPSGNRQWKLGIHNPDAISLSFVFSTFKLSNGSVFWVENKKGEKVSDVLTTKDMLEDFQQNVAKCFGDEFVLILTDKKDQPESELNLSRIFYNYRLKGRHSLAKINESDATCEVNINCSEGDNYQEEKRGVALVDLIDGGSEYLCSGSVVNNLAQDCKPLFLMALHCGVSTSAAEMLLWKFYFRYEAPTCVNPTTVGTLFSHYITSCVRLSDAGDNGGDSGSDFLLLHMGTVANEAATITSLKSADINAYWNGWDANNVASTTGVGIHHPSGDIAKISTYTTALVSETFGGTVPNTHWQVVWAATANGHGVTEEGSSGSPLFTYNGGSSRIVGTLTGGSSFCTALTSPDDYGKVSYHWTSNGTTANRRLKDFLDPNNTGLLVMNGSANPCATGTNGITELTGDASDITIFPNPATDKLNVDLSALEGQVNIKIFDITGKLVVNSTNNGGSVIDVNLNTFTKGLYQVVIDSNDKHYTKRVSIL